MDQKVDILAVSRKRVLVQQMQDKSDAIVEDINILLGETKTSKETMDALNALQKTFWGKIQSLVQDAVESERQGLNAEVEERIKMVLTRVDQNGDKRLTEKGIQWSTDLVEKLVTAKFSTKSNFLLNRKF